MGITISPLLYNKVMSISQFGPEVEVSAKVFRARKTKPKYMPSFIFRLCKKLRIKRLGGSWQDLGVLK